MIGTGVVSYILANQQITPLLFFEHQQQVASTPYRPIDGLRHF